MSIRETVTQLVHRMLPQRGELAFGQGRASIAETLAFDWQNPDEIAQEKGLAYYDEIARDPHVKSVWQTRILALVGCPREFSSASDSPYDKRVTDFVRWNFEQKLKKRDTDTIVGQMFRAASKNGYTVQEIIWDPKHPRGCIIEDIKDRDPERFVIKPDGVYLKEHHYDTDGIKMSDRKFIVAPFQPEYENPYGTSLFQAIHWYVWFKKNGFKFWLIFLEKYGMPTAKGTVPAGTRDEDERKFRNALDSIKTHTSITIPEGFEVEMLEAARTGSAVEGYSHLIQVCNREISKAILGQTLTTEEGMRSGSFAQASVHGDVRNDILKADGKWIDQVLNWQPIAWLVEYNFNITQIDMQRTASGMWEADSFLQGYPFIHTQTEPEEDLKLEAEIDEKLVAMGVKLPQKYFYEKYNRPEPKEGEETVGSGQLAVGSGQLAIRSAKEPLQTFAEEPTPNPSQADSGLTGNKREAPTDKLFEAVLKQGSALYQECFVLPYQHLTEVATDFDAYTSNLDAFKFGTKPFAQYLAEILVSAHILGRWVMQQRVKRSAKAELSLSKRSFDTPESFAEGDELVAEVLDEPLTMEEAAVFVAEKEIMSAEAFAALSDEMKRAAFAIAGVEDTRVLELVKTQLEQAIIEGLTFKEFQAKVEDVFEAYGVTDVADHHVRTIFRTNIQTAYHEGAWQLLHDPAVTEIVQYLQYDAIDDSRTRPAHAAVDGVTLPMDDPFWDLWWPPNGYNCRCDVIPVTKYEVQQHPGTYTQTERIPDQVEMQLKTKTKLIAVKPDTGFSGTPKVGGEELQEGR